MGPRAAAGVSIGAVVSFQVLPRVGLVLLVAEAYLSSAEHALFCGAIITAEILMFTLSSGCFCRVSGAKEKSGWRARASLV
jgi:hypothetical protein